MNLYGLLKDSARRAPQAALLLGGTLVILACCGVAVTLLATFGIERMVLVVALCVPAAFGGILIGASQGRLGRGLLACSFCRASQREVRKLIAGPGVHICDTCVALCVDILREDVEGGASPPASPTEPTGGGDGA